MGSDLRAGAIEAMFNAGSDSGRQVGPYETTVRHLDALLDYLWHNAPTRDSSDLLWMLGEVESE